MTMEEKSELKVGIEYLKATDDSMLVELANIMEKNDNYPSEEEMVQILVFFFTFSMGCRDMKLAELADIFNRRAERFISTLRKFGMGPGRMRHHVKKTWEPLSFNKIITRATSIAAYKAAGSVNSY